MRLVSAECIRYDLRHLDDFNFFLFSAGLSHDDLYDFIDSYYFFDDLFFLQRVSDLDLFQLFMKDQGMENSCMIGWMDERRDGMEISWLFFKLHV